MMGDSQGTLSLGSGEGAEVSFGATLGSPVIESDSSTSLTITINGEEATLNEAFRRINEARARRVAAVPRRSGTYKVRLGDAAEEFGLDPDEEIECDSVTASLGAVGKPQLVTWGARTAAGLVLDDPMTYSTPEQAASGIYKVRDKAGTRGSTIHSLIEAVMGGAPIELEQLPPTVRGYGQAFHDWYLTHRPRHMLSELQVVNVTHRYAGTADLIALLADDQVWLIDFKTSAGFYPEHSLQLAAYRNAELVRPKGDAFYPLPPINKTGVVLLREDGTWAMKEMVAPFEVYLSVLGVWRWLNAA